MHERNTQTQNPEKRNDCEGGVHPRNGCILDCNRADCAMCQQGKENAPVIVGGRYGLSSKNTTPAMMLSVFENLKLNEPKNGFTVGIVDDVTFKSLPLLPEISIGPEGTFEGKFYGLGSDGTVGANKNSIKIIGESTDKYCQAYFAYDSKKSGGIFSSDILWFILFTIFNECFVSIF